MAKFNFYLGAAASSWILAVLVALSELVEPFKNMLTKYFTHHWIGKAVLVTLSFIVFGIMLKNKESLGKFSSEKIAWYSMIGSMIAIFLFFIILFFIE